MHVTSDRAAVRHHCLVDELFIFVGPRVEDFLNHMIAVDFACQLNELPHQVL